VNRKPLVVGAIALTLVALSSCTNKTGAAGYVGSTRLPVSTVQSETAEVLAAATGVTQNQLDASEVNRRQVNRWITEQLILAEAARLGITVSDGEVDALIRSAIGSGDRTAFVKQLAASQLVPPSKLTDFARTVALNQRISAKLAPGAPQTAQTYAIVKELGKLSIQLGTGVSARYGTWDPTALTVALPPNDLSTPAPIAQVTSGTVQNP